MSVIATKPNRWRENAPLWGVSAILLLAFVLLAQFGTRPVPPAAEAKPAARTAPHPDLSTLPASAGSDAVIVSQLTPDEARARNAAAGFADGPLRPARAFVFRGNLTDRLRARECLALAALAEAGAGDADQRAVMQVILNRVRHPAFANTVCGVVFEGSERATGCQFTFTCDGALDRTYPEALWAAARARADEALGGAVYAPVGNATHYHTDWVYPWWSPKLDKVAQVGTHLFFRWRGFWGTPASLSARYAGGEPDPLVLTRRAEAVERPSTLRPLLTDDGEAVLSITAPLAPDGAPQSAPGAAPVSAGTPGSPAPGVHFVLVASGDAPAQLIEHARALCPGDRYCQVYGWDNAATIPSRLPLTEDARRALRFSFLAARDGNPEVAYFDCRLFPAPQGGSCLPRARP